MIKIAGVDFTGLAAPESFKLGGEQKFVEKELPGGTVVYQPRGYFSTRENTWEGSLYRPDAMEIVMRFDRLCSTRESVLVEFGSYSYFCFIAKWEWDWKRDNEVYFTITLKRDFAHVNQTADADPVAVAQAAVPAKAAATSVTQKEHVVVLGDSLWRISAKYGVSVDALYQRNKSLIGANPSMIKVGQRLVIPG